MWLLIAFLTGEFLSLIGKMLRNAHVNPTLDLGG